ncbi:unnamed protein product [Adineta steineri]|uniref:Uncharacterized protein n=1 Tax=Adineta steineri TaxID=433720 RepID=A0A814M945_9BILA|nr:unnamed protein product [Adineta steineri]CAF1164214.1 unnamed protein product [Adineta steineri]
MLSPEVYTDDIRGLKYIDEDVVYKRRTRVLYDLVRGFFLLLQALAYICASAMYFDSVIHQSYALKVGAALYKAGATFKLFAEIPKIFKDRVGLFLYAKYRLAYTLQRIEEFTYLEYSFVEGFIRTEIALSDLFLILSAALDLARAILYIQQLNTLTCGIYLFIASMSILLSADMWIIYQLGRMEKDDPYNLTFRCRNACRNIVKFLFRLFSAFAALFYIIGSTLYLPEYDKNASDQDNVGALYEAGAGSFFVSAIMGLLDACIGDV